MDHFDYFDKYNKLYSVGYHAKGKNHGQRFVDFIYRHYNGKIKTILDAGCSNGLTVRKFKDTGMRAYGIDVAEIAIRYANEISGARNCLIASVTDIPFRDNFFDAVFSCDMLEHLHPLDVEDGVREIVRVAKKYLFLTIDGEYERNREFLDKAKFTYKNEFKKVSNLHLTVWKHDKWIDLFKKYGAEFKKTYNGLMIFNVKH